MIALQEADSHEASQFGVVGRNTQQQRQQQQNQPDFLVQANVASYRVTLCSILRIKQ